MTAKSAEDETRTPSGRKRALLDTNIWRYVVDNDAQGRLLGVARDGSYDVQIAPGVIYETLRLKDTSLRATLVRLMTNARFHRLMPEAYSESMEILREIERIRPDWLRDAPDLRFFNRLKKDWTRRTGGFWVRCERSPQSEARFISQLEGGLIEGAKTGSQLARKEMIDTGWKRNPPMDKTLAGFSFPVPGWRGDMVEAWRIDSLVGITYAVARQGHAYRDWMAPFIELDDGLLRSASWGEFWLYLTDKSALPRQWMRWAHSFAQRFRKVSSGAPGDTQLSTYFVETDVVITADRAMIEILEECRPYSAQHCRSWVNHVIAIQPHRGPLSAIAPIRDKRDRGWIVRPARRSGRGRPEFERNIKGLYPTESISNNTKYCDSIGLQNTESTFSKKSQQCQ